MVAFLFILFQVAFLVYILFQVAFLLFLFQFAVHVIGSWNVLAFNNKLNTNSVRKIYIFPVPSGHVLNGT